jgi:hypothetical protein
LPSEVVSLCWSGSRRLFLNPQSKHQLKNTLRPSVRDVPRGLINLYSLHSSSCVSTATAAPTDAIGE